MSTFLFIISSYSFSSFGLSNFPSFIFFLILSKFPREMKTSLWEWGGMLELWVRRSVLSDVSVCFTTLSSVNEKEEVSSVISSDQPSCPICVSLCRFALSHTHLASLSRFTISSICSLRTSYSTSTYRPVWLRFLSRACSISKPVFCVRVKPRESFRKLPCVIPPHWYQMREPESYKFINTFTADKTAYHLRVSGISRVTMQHFRLKL